MKTIILNSRVHGIKECLVDDEDYGWLMEGYSIYLCKVKHAFYVDCRRKDDPLKLKRKLHRVIFRRHHPLKDTEWIDHEDGNPLNNRKSNLRIATQSQNCINRDKGDGAHTSVYKGVTQQAGGGWYSRIKRHSRYTCIGVFDTERDAAIAYDMMAREMYGTFAVLNVPDASAQDLERVRALLANPKRRRGRCYSRYLGVSFDKNDERWTSWFRIPGAKTNVNVGHFATEIEAAAARDQRINDGGYEALGVRKCLVTSA